MPEQSTPPTPAVSTAQPAGLGRQVLLILSFTVGTGAFVGVGLATGIAADGILSVLVLASLIALVNRCSIVWFTISKPADTRLTHPDWLQFIADWTLFLTKLTVAAIAALGIAGYLLNGLRLTEPIWLIPTAVAAIVVLAKVSVWGQSLQLIQITGILAIVALLGLIVAGLPTVPLLPLQDFRSQVGVLNFAVGNPEAGNLDANLFTVLQPLVPFFQATALISVAYAGYEDLPVRFSASIRQTLMATCLSVFLMGCLYAGIAVVGLSKLGALALGNTTEAQMAPLISIMQTLVPGGVYLIMVGAVAVMAGMLMRLLPNLAQALLRLSYSPITAATAQPSGMQLSPRLAKLLISVALGCIVLAGELKTIWSFSACLFLLHSALMHWIALWQRSIHRYRWLHQLGLTACLFLAFWVSWDVWLVSLGLIALALIWRGVQYWSEDPEV